MERNNLFGHALVASVIAEVNRDRKQRSKPFTPMDFMPGDEPKEQRKEQTWQEQLENVKRINKLLGGIEVIENGDDRTDEC